MKTTKKISVLMLLAVLMLNIKFTAFAHDVPEPGRSGSISVTMEYDKTPVPGGTLSLYRVGNASEDDGNYHFVLNSEFADSQAALDDIQTDRTAQKLASFAADHRISGVTKNIDNSGKVSFDNLEIGLYLMVQEEASAGYYAVEPFLVSVPFMEDGIYIYDVNASPKTELKSIPHEPETESSVPEKTTSNSFPQTGQYDWPVILILILMGLSLCVIGCTLRFRSRTDGHKE